MTADGPVFHVRLKGKASITLFDDNNTDEAVDHNSLIQSKLEEKIKSEVKKRWTILRRREQMSCSLGCCLNGTTPRNGRS